MIFRLSRPRRSDVYRRPVYVSSVLMILGAWNSVPSFGQDWNQWRGPNRDGIVTAAPPKWPGRLTKKWQAQVGIGHSSPLIVRNSVYAFTREGEEEVVRRLDLNTGKEIWRSGYPAPYAMNPAAQGHGKGPKSTPTYSGGLLYTLGISGIVSCLDGASGGVRWRHDFTKQFKATSPLYGAAASPLVDNGLCTFFAGGNDNGALIAFDAKSGVIRWRWTGDGPGYSSPIAVTIGGVRQIVLESQDHCVGVEEESGKLLWSLPFKTPFAQNIVTPVIAGGSIVFAGERQPTFAVRVRKSDDEWKAVKTWETGDVTMYMSTPVAVNGRLYGMSERRGGQMFCLDAATGKTLWTGDGRMGENAAILSAGGYILAQTNSSDLIVYKIAPDALREVSRFQVAQSPTWATPAIVGDRIVVKDRDSLILWEIPK